MRTAAMGLALATMASAAAEDGVKNRTFGEDVAFLKEHTSVIVLQRGEARVALAPAYQGRVMTSTTGGDAGPSFGWLNDKVIAAGVVPAAERKGKLEDHLHVVGGEERFWMGPEGGQFSLFFAPGTKFEFADWHTPAFIDTEPFPVIQRSATSARFGREVEVVNYSGAKFSFSVDRAVRLLDAAAVKAMTKTNIPAGVQAVAYETDNRVQNRGPAAWTKQTGMLSIWLLGMYKPSPLTTVVIPFKAGPEAALGPKVNDAYFGKVPKEYLVVKDDVLFFRGDGTRRGKIGISPKRSKGIAGSYDAAGKVLTLVTYNVPDQHEGYVNSMWELQKDPFSGDALNSYNDGSPGPGLAPLGPFYELETSSPAAALKAGDFIRHVSRTAHLTGDEAGLDPVARAALGVSLADIKAAFPGK